MPSRKSSSNEARKHLTAYPGAPMSPIAIGLPPAPAVLTSVALLEGSLSAPSAQGPAGTSGAAFTLPAPRTFLSGEDDLFKPTRPTSQHASSGLRPQRGARAHRGRLKDERMPVWELALGLPPMAAKCFGWVTVQLFRL